MIIIILLGCWFDWALWRTTSNATTWQLPPKADVIIVLGCGPGMDGKVSKCQKARVGAGVELWQAGIATNIIVTGGETGRGIEAQFMADVAKQLGVPDAQVVLENQSHNTVENLRFSKALMNERGWHSVILVSDPYHLYRAREQAADLQVDVVGWWPALASENWQEFWRRNASIVRDTISLMLYESLGWLLYRT